MNSTRITARGDWPGPVTLRSGWWKAVCRRLNDDMADVSLRIERGSRDFVDRCAAMLLGQDAPAVWSPPLAPTASSMWTASGFAAHQQLALMERTLTRPIGSVAVPSRRGEESDWPVVADIDRAAFDGTWRMGGVGLRDAMTATPRSRFIVLEIDGSVVGFSVVGLAIHTGYLQRIAVRPDLQGQGLGRSMLRESMSWARAGGARSMLLNTQLDNQGAAALYESEGFVRLPDRLTLYRRTPEGLL